MPRLKTTAPIEKKIALQKAKIIKLENRLEKAKGDLQLLMQEHERICKDRVYEAFKRSNKSLEQLMVFLGPRS